MRQLVFAQNKTELLTLDELRSTYDENLPDGTPVGGIHHYDFISIIAEKAEKAGLKAEICEIFAADNRDRLRPGVTVLKNLEQQYGQGAVEAHLLRRVYANIEIRDDETDETVTCLAVAYHQQGIQVGIGPMVKVCRNQTILGAQDVASTFRNYGSERHTLDGVCAKVDNWMLNYAEDARRRQQTVEKLKETHFGNIDYYTLLGALLHLRVSADSSEARLRALTPQYPLNSAQLNSVAEDFAVAQIAENGDFIVDCNYWDAYQKLNTVLKPGHCDIPRIIPQSLCLFNVLCQMSDING